ncbi:MAG: flagellar basal body-associated protein FliL [Ignavibacteria bacterium]
MKRSLVGRALSRAISILSPKAAMVVLLCALGSPSHAADGKAGAYVDMDPFVVALKGNARITLALKLKLSSPQHADYVRAQLPVLKDALTRQVVGRDAAQLQTPAAMNDFADMSARLAKKIAGSGYVDGVAIAEWTVQ